MPFKIFHFSVWVAVSHWSEKLFPCWVETISLNVTQKAIQRQRPRAFLRYICEPFRILRYLKLFATHYASVILQQDYRIKNDSVLFLLFNFFFRKSDLTLIIRYTHPVFTIDIDVLQRSSNATFHLNFTEIVPCRDELSPNQILRLNYCSLWRSDVGKKINVLTSLSVNVGAKVAYAAQLPGS